MAFGQTSDAHTDYWKAFDPSLDDGLPATVGWDGNSSFTNASSIPFCIFLVVHTIGESHVGIWDLVILIPNTIFLLFLVSTVCHSARRLTQVSSPVYNTFYVLIFLTCVAGTLRCAVTISVKGFNALSDQILWLSLRFFQLATELSVLILGLLFGQSDSRRSIQRVLTITITISLGYVFIQGVLQQTGGRDVILDQNIYPHGGLPFWFGSSVLFFFVYVSAVLLRYVPSFNCCGLVVPVKARFYYYSLFMAGLNLLQSIGSGMVLFKEEELAGKGFCLIDMTTLVLFSLFSPIVYMIFLWEFFKPGILPQNERSHLLDISYNDVEPVEQRASIISDKTSIRAPTTYGSSAPKEVAANGAFPLSYNSLTNSYDENYFNSRTQSYTDTHTEPSRPQSPDSVMSYGFRTPLQRSFVASYESTGSLNCLQDTDLSDFEDLTSEASSVRRQQGGTPSTDVPL